MQGLQIYTHHCNYSTKDMDIDLDSDVNLRGILMMTFIREEKEHEVIY